MNFFELLVESFPRLLQGLGLTLQITTVSLVIATVLGFLTCFMTISESKTLHILAKIYLTLIRGTPLIVQAFFLYFGVPNLVQSFGEAMNIAILSQFRLNLFAGGVIVLSLNAGAYMSEIFRSGINAIDKGQMEAARSLGLNRNIAMVTIILPQAVKIVIPSLLNQFIITLKDTSILSAIGLNELTKSGQLIIARNFESFKIWFIVGCMYLVIVMILTRISDVIEQKLEISSPNK